MWDKLLPNIWFPSNRLFANKIKVPFFKTHERTTLHKGVYPSGMFLFAAVINSRKFYTYSRTVPQAKVLCNM